jgi:hypothetical protein
MSTDSWSWLLALSENDIPANPIVASDDEFQDLLNTRQSDQVFESRCRNYYVESWIESRRDLLPELDYVAKYFAVLGQAEVQAAVLGLQKAITFVLASWVSANPGRSSMTREEVLAASTDALLEASEPDRDNDLYLLYYLKNHLAVLNGSVGRNQPVLYVLYNDA